MKDYVCYILLLILLSSCTYRINNPVINVNEPLLQMLDSTISCADKYILEKENRIKSLKISLAHLSKDEDLFNLYSSLYWEYRVYDADSALKYVNQNLQLADKCKNEFWKMSSLLDLSFIYTANGLLDEAEKALRALDTHKMPRDLLSRHYGQMKTLCSRRQLYSSGNKKLHDYWGSQYALYSDSVLQIATPDEPRYIYAKVWKYQDDAILRKELIKQLEKNKKKSYSNSRNHSILLYNLASLYEKDGNIEEWMKNMILAAISDIRGVNRDVGSLHALASYLYENGSLDRAYHYSEFCSEIGYTFKSRVRLLHLSKLQNKIHQSYIERDREQQIRLHGFLMLVTVLSLILIAALFLLFQQVKKRKEANFLLKDMNQQLRVLNQDILQINEELRDSNFIKEEYIGQIFNLCSYYIGKMEEFRRSLKRKIKVGQIEDINKLINISNWESHEMKEFYHSFDSIFLNLFPNFISDFNSLLRPDEQIYVKEHKLNTELRIQALIRLGITDSEKIAEFLHCSPQTVYNNRSITCSKSVLPKEEFIQAVKELGKLS